jgi:hypothetical protein
MEIAEKTAGFDAFEAKLLGYTQKEKGSTIAHILAEKIIADTAYNAVEEVVQYDEQYLGWLSETELESIDFDKETYTVIFSGKETSFEVIIGAVKGELESFTIICESNS